MKKILMLSLATLVLTSACAKKSTDAVDSNGSCTDATINAFNKINSMARKYSDGSDVTLTDINKECAAFKNLIGDQSCKATDVATGETITVNRDHKVCKVAQSFSTQKSARDSNDEVIPLPTEQKNKSADKGSKKSSKTRKIVEDNDASEEAAIVLSPLAK